MSKGRKCNKAYWEVEEGLSKDPCFFVYNGECWKTDGIICPMPKIPKDHAKKVRERKIMKDKKIYRIVCSPNEVWSVQEMVETDYRSDWMEAYRCIAQGEAGYHEAKKWIKENDK